MQDFVEMKRMCGLSSETNGVGIVLSSDDRYFMMSVPSYRAQQFHHLYCGKCEDKGLSNSFVRNVLDVTGERVESLSIDSLDENVYNSTLKMSGCGLSPVVPSVGLQFALVGAGKIMVRNDYLMDKSEVIKKRIPDKSFFEKLEFEELAKAKTKAREEKPLMADKYENCEFSKIGKIEKRTTAITPVGIIHMSTSANVPVYGNKDRQTAIHPMDNGMYTFGMMDKMIKISDKELKGLEKKKKLNNVNSARLHDIGKFQESVMVEMNKPPRYEYADIIKYLFDVKNWKLSEVYLDGDREKKGDVDLFMPTSAFISLEHNGKAKNMEASVEAAVPMGIRYLDSLMLRKP